MLAERSSNEQYGKHLPPVRGFRLGMRFGVVLVLFVWMAWDCLVDATLYPLDRNNRWISNVFPIYRGLGCFVILGWLWGINVFVWKKYGIAYTKIFGLDPSTTLSEREIFREATTVSIVFLVNFIVYYKILRHDFPAWIPAGYFPPFLIIFGFYKVLHPQSRCNILGVLPAIKEVVISPVGEVTFLSAYVGDLLTSLVKPMIDLAYGACFIFSGEFLDHNNMIDAACLSNFSYTRVAVPLISAMPLWFRFMQNLRKYQDTGKRHPFLPNAGKYAVAHSIILFAVFHPEVNTGKDITAWWQALFVISLLVSTIYSFIWDVFMDWGLGSHEHMWLRDRKLFPEKTVYYACIAADLVLRFTWTLTLITRVAASAALTKELMHYISPFLAVAELFRRTMWSCFRLENEHLNNHTGSRIQYEASSSGSPQNGSPRRGWLIIVEVGALVACVLIIAFTAVLTGVRDANAAAAAAAAAAANHHGPAHHP